MPTTPRATLRTVPPARSMKLGPMLGAARADHLWLRYDWDNDNEFDDDPEATATFGIFEGEPVQIYIQQTFE